MDAVLEKLHVIFQSNKNRQVFMAYDTFHELINLLPLIKTMKDRGPLLMLLRLQDDALPLELLNILHKEDIILFSTYLFWRRDYVVNEIVSELINLVFENHHSNEENATALLRDILLILSTYGQQSLPEIFEIGSAILSSFVQQVSGKLLDRNFTTYNVKNYLAEMKNSRFKKKLEQFFTNHLILMLCCNDNGFTDEEVISKQLHECIPTDYSKPLILFFETIFKSLERKKTFVHLMTIITSNRFNWKALLIAVSVYYRIFPEEGPESLKAFTDGLFKKALAERSNAIFTIVLLLVRQCCANEIPHFMSYPNWIGSLNLKTENEAEFFYKFLEEIIPYDPPVFLKVQVNKGPIMQPSCQIFLTNYAMIAKTRLLDLNETTEYLGLFNDYHILQQKQISDVDKVLAHFERTGEIMSTVLEAAVFRKQYYTNTFLTELIKPSDEPGKGKFIEKLYEAGKIPQKLYRDWRMSNRRSWQPS